jgi:folylpolyglutamate synthase/dihydropteroate synthase
VIACRPEIPRARDPEEVASAARALGVPASLVEVVDDVADAVARAVATTAPEGEVVVAGSLYVAGPARTALLQ